MILFLISSTFIFLAPQTEIVAHYPVKYEMAKVSYVASAVGTGLPTRLVIPGIDVNAKIEHLGLTSEGAVAAPAGGENVAWFNLGPRPGQAGNAIISGHYGRWQNSMDSVFNRLPELREGDAISVKDGAGNSIAFTVKNLKVYGKDDEVPELFDSGDTPRLIIITCHGAWLPLQQTYSHRLAVFAEKNPT